MKDEGIEGSDGRTRERKDCLYWFAKDRREFEKLGWKDDCS